MIRNDMTDRLGLRRKPGLEIVLDGPSGYIHNYSTFDQISGHVNVRFDKSTTVDEIIISFQGQSETVIEKMTTTSPWVGRSTARHIFLRMQQPIDHSPFGQNNLAEAGRLYRIPFTFVVPERLLPFVCRHGVQNDHVKHQHLLLPPSIGESALAGEGQFLMDDLAPAMSKIKYCIRARVAKVGPTGRQFDVLQASVPVRISPVRDEQLPQDVQPVHHVGSSSKYQLRREKNIRRGILGIGKKQGRLTAETSQPRSLKLAHQSRPRSEPPTSMAKIHLRFDPTSAGQSPPTLTSVKTKLKALTFFGVGAFSDLPDPDRYDIWSTIHAYYPETIDLSSLNLSSVSWEKHEATSRPVSVSATPTRKASSATTHSGIINTLLQRSTTAESATRASSGPDGTRLQRSGSQSSQNSTNSNNTDSSVSSSSTAMSPNSARSNPFETHGIITPSTDYQANLPFYTATVLVPIALPSSTNTESTSEILLADTTAKLMHKRRTTFLPTFHSCLISRIYTLELNLSSTGSASSISLRVPIQIESERNPNAPQTAEDVPPPIDEGTSAPREWYDPFSLAMMEQSLAAEEGMITRDDEAIARALSEPNVRSPEYGSIDDAPVRRLQDQSIPEYSELDIMRPVPRHGSIAEESPRRLVSSDAPPEYYSTFRRQSTPAVSLGAHSTNNRQTGSASATRRFSLRAAQALVGR